MTRCLGFGVCAAQDARALAHAPGHSDRYSAGLRKIFRPPPILFRGNYDVFWLRPWVLAAHRCPGPLRALCRRPGSLLCALRHVPPRRGIGASPQATSLRRLPRRCRLAGSQTLLPLPGKSRNSSKDSDGRSDGPSVCFHVAAQTAVAKTQSVHDCSHVLCCLRIFLFSGVRTSVSVFVH